METCSVPSLISASTCLNRTMQYGNNIKNNGKKNNNRGLNRTMQYGNLFENLSVTGKYITFKSYYVVWKQNNKMALPLLLIFV